MYVAINNIIIAQSVGVSRATEDARSVKCVDGGHY